MNVKDIIKKILMNLPEYLLYLFVFLLPWQTRWIARDCIINGEPLEYGRISFYGLDIILIIILLFCYIVLLLKKKKLEGGGDYQELEIRNQKLGVVFYCLLFSFYCLLTTLWASDKGVSLHWGIRMLLGFGLFLVMSKINFSRVRLAIVMVVSGAIQGLLGIWQFINQNIGQSKWLGMAGKSAEELGASVVEFGIERWIRAYGSLPHPNIYGALLVIAFLAVIYLITKIEHKYHKLFLIFSASFILLGILFSYSRGAWLVLACLYLAGIIVVWRIKENWISGFGMGLLAYGLMLLLVFVFATWPIAATRLGINGPERLEIKSTAERIDSYRLAGEIIKDNWLVGTGIGNYTLAVEERYPDLKTWDIQPVHNVYLLIIGELGILGFLFLIGTHGYMALWLKKQKKIGYAWLFFCFLVFLMLDHFWWTSATGLYAMWLISGLVFKVIKEKKLEI